MSDKLKNQENSPKPVVSKETEGDKIWKEIKDRKVNMFALPNRLVSDYAKPVNIEPSKCYLQFSVPAFIPALEEALGNEFTFTQEDKYLVISRV